MEFGMMERSYTFIVVLNIWKNDQTPGMEFLELVVVSVFNLCLHKTDFQKIT